MLAAAYADSGSVELAKESLQSAIQRMPAEPTLRIELARILGEYHELDQSAAVLEQGVLASPESTLLREELIRAYLQKRDFAAARKAADDFAVLSPKSPAPPYLAGLAWEGLNQPAEARKAFERSVAINAKALDVLDALARLDIAEGKNAQAIARIQQVVHDDPGNAMALNVLGGVYLAEKNIPQAIEVLTRTTELAPGWSVGYRNLALAKFAGADVPGALAAYHSAIKAAPDKPELVVELAGRYESLGRVDDALNTYKEWHEHRPRMPVFSANLAKLLVTYRTDRASLDLARDLTRTFETSNDVSLLDTSGWVHFKRGEFGEAVSVLKRAAARGPNVPEVRYHLGMAELSAGQSTRAREDLQSAVSAPQKWSWSDDARRALATLSSSRS